MSMHSLGRKPNSSYFPKSKLSVRSKGRRPQLEILEQRVVLSTSFPLNSTSWTQLGPAPILNGQAPGRPAVSGRVAALAGDPINPLTIYAAAAGGGVWKSINGGTSWAPLTDSQQTMFMGSIAVAPSNGQIIYAGTGEANYSGDSFYGRGVLKSTDGGTTWSLLGNAQFNRLAISSISISPTDPNLVYVTTAGAVNGLVSNFGVWKTTNGGTTWANTTTAISTTNSFDAVVMDPTNPLVLYTSLEPYSTSSPKGVYKTSDGGTTWALAGNFPQAATVGRTSLSISKTSPNILLASVANLNTGALLGLYETTDNGTTWNANATVPEYLNPQGWYDNAVAIDPTNASIFYATGTGTNLIVESIDGGTTWTNISTGTDGKGPHTDAHTLAFSAAGKLLFGSDGGVWRLANSTPGSQLWNDLNTNLAITQFTGIAIHPTNPDIAYGGSQDNGTEKFTDAQGWNLIQFGDGGFVRLDHSNPNTVYHTFFRQVGSGPFFFERSDDAGANWLTKGTGIATGDSSLFYVPYIIDPSNQSRLLLGTDHVYVSTDRADNWAAISAFNTNGWTTTASIECLATAPSDGRTIYVSVGGAIYITTNTGATWTKSVVTGATDGFDSIQVDPANSLIAYAVRSQFNVGSNVGHIFRTNDGGATWANISGSGATGLPDLPSHALVMDSRLAQRVLYLGNDDGVYVSNDTGANWARFGAGLPHTQVTDLDFSPTLDILGAGTHGRGLFEISTLKLTVTAVAPTGVVEGARLAGVTVATIKDQGGTGLLATINWGDGTITPGTVINDGGGNFHVIGTHLYVETGTYTLAVSLTDAQLNSASNSISVSVAEAPITAIQGSAINSVEGTVLTNIVVATFTDADPNGTLADYFATINWNDGTITPGVVVANGVGGYKVLGTHPVSAGNYTILVSIGESGVVLATANLSATVADLPLTAGVPITIAAVEGLAFAGVVATFGDPDPNARVSLYTAVISWGDGTNSPGTFIALGAGRFSVSGTHTYLEEAQGRVVSVLISDVGGAVTTAPGVANVADAPLTAGAPITITGTEGISLSKTVATFSDADPNGTVTDYTATINWGDGTSSPGTIVALVSGEFSVGGVHIYAEEGLGFVVSVVITDVGGATTTATGTANVADAPLSGGQPLVVQAFEGQTFTTTVASFGDADPNGTIFDYTAIINWGDGTSSAGVIVAQAGGKFGVNGTHKYDEENSSVVLSIAVTDSGGSTVTLAGTALVADAPLTAGSPLTLTTTKAQTFTTRVANFTDADPNGTISDYQTKINWGDGSTSIGVVVALPGGGFGVVGTHAYLKLSTGMTVSTTIKDAGGASTTALASASVNPPINIAAVEGQSVTSLVALFSAPNPDTAQASDFNASITWGDGLTSPGVVVAQGSGLFGVMGTHSYSEEALKKNLSIVISSMGNVVTSATATATVTDAPLVAGAPLTIAPTEGIYFFGQVANFTDSDPNGVASDYAAYVKWDDGTTSFGSITALAGGVYSVSAAHGFPKQATGLGYSVLITDVGGATTTALGSANVADAPLTSGLPVTLAAIEGEAFTGAVAKFTDANPAGAITDYVALISWGDGTTTAGTIVQLKGGGFAVNGTHQYIEEASYSTSTTITSLGGSPPIQAAGLAVVTDAPLTLTPVSLVITESQTFNGVVAKFVDGSAFADLADFSASILWGDGAISNGIITQSGTDFLISGTHVYSESGNFPLQVSVADRGGSQSLIAVPLVVQDQVVPVTGRLVNANNQPIGSTTNSTQPRFTGNSEAGSVVTLLVQGGSFATPTPIGVTTADASGLWSLTVGSALANGSYTITATAADFLGNSSSPTEVLIPNLVIDTVAPRIMNVAYGARGNQLIVTLQDTGTGIDPGTLGNMANYQLVPNGRSAITLSLAGIVITPGPGANQQTTVVTLNLGPHSRLGKATFTVRSGGISDLAGNALDGEFRDFLPSGNGVAGGDMVARLNFATGTFDPIIGPAPAPRRTVAPAPIHPRGPVVTKAPAVRPKFVAQKR